MNDLHITLIQCDLAWEDRRANLESIQAHLQKISTSTDLIVLPEMFTTGFSMSPQKVAEPFDSQDMETLNMMRNWSRQLSAVITGSVSVSENGKYYNRLLWVRPDGSYSQYNKRHLFQLAGEHEQYTPGDKLLITEIKGWKICPLICYDLRFPVWSRNRIIHEKPMYDVLVYTANWPELRREPWKKLLLARALENQAYVAGVNRVGTDASGFLHTGDSSIINPRGEYIKEAEPLNEQVLGVNLSWNYLEEFRKKFPVLYDADQFEIN